MKLVRTTGRGKAEAQRVLLALEGRQESSAESVAPVVRKIIGQVRKSGDRALRRLVAQLDGVSPQSQLQIMPDEMQLAWNETPEAVRGALQTAAKNIRAFAERQLPGKWSLAPIPGLSTGQLVRPIDAVGCYVPSGRHPLPSSLLMTVIPAQVAGVERIVVASPNPARETLAAAHLLGVDCFYQMGGAQAIAVLAYGTETIARVDKIVGPGNLYVTTAKRLVAFDCAIDMLAGPTEIVVTSDKGNAAYIAADLVAQAEHDPHALAVLVTTQPSLAAEVIHEVKTRAKSNPVAKESLHTRGFVFLTGSLDEARTITNRLAPEHLTVDSQADLSWVRNAGSVFVGDYSTQPMGDYISGPNHTLPTGGLARVRGGLSVMDFIKLITVQSYNRSALKSLGPSAIAIAEAEGLDGHADAIRSRSIGRGKTSSSRRSAGA
ncbi:Histidinol dehydrogenase [Acidisarcina polymorpha]|uniref:Histidinol dehydrogenase n=1 Tax=Acidisarcina polymorpha TaxID=2211140 RepID=A0A2Z5G7X1_9BACT|nr:histidinol dehydrogenase [Acidisarcina polymorpha]AXC15373.1 Histidinol dehydrogenase [Acidisarcina polymorpha]